MTEFDIPQDSFSVWQTDSELAGFLPRRWLLQGILFLVPVILSGFSYLVGGERQITDLSFVVLALLCSFFLIGELLAFPRRQGIGGVLIFGGVLIWFCHDYFSNWFGNDFLGQKFTPVVIAKDAFYTCLFVNVMVLAVNAPLFLLADRAVVCVPEPRSSRGYVLVLLLLMAIGALPFFVNVRESPLVTLVKAGTFNADTIEWSGGRNGNLNYNWEGYYAQVLQVGQMAGIFGALYAIFIARSWVGKLLGFACYYFWVSYSFGSYRRGDMAFMGLPLVGFYLIRYINQMHARHAERGIDSGAAVPVRALLVAGIVGFGLFAVIQYQGSFRDKTETLELTASRGNTMFSEGLRAWAVYPDSEPFYYDRFPGAGIILPVPYTIFWFLIDPFPRALWNDKPTEQFNIHYNHMNVGGNEDSAEGTTISNGAVGAWYFRFGPAGVIEGALIYGWLMGVAERSFRRVHGRPIALMFSLGFITFMFRAYRDLFWHALYPLMIAGAVMFVLIRLINFLDAPETNPQWAPA